ncbi:MAG: hypothetical protein LAN70_13255 [Acidobacteriia bacterium]|nr:hypothetical protein [Terriglobia bacterium]
MANLACGARILSLGFSGAKPINGLAEGVDSPVLFFNRELRQVLKDDVG